MDPFDDIVALLRPTAMFSKSITGRGRWGVRYTALEAPGFAIVLAGEAWLAIESQDPIRLERGDFVLMPSSPAFAMMSHPGAHCVAGQPSQTALRHGDPHGDPDFEMLGGSFQLHPVNAPLLVSLLPPLIHIRSSEAATGRLARIIDLIIEECDAVAPGRDTILQRLLEIMLVECLRSPGIAAPAPPVGLLAGMRDSAIARALIAIHSDLRAGWTITELGKRAGMSRSAFAARFSDVLGCAPMEYILRWRMTIARDVLSWEERPLERLAEDIGYASASAFSTAFRRRNGCSPGAFARAARLPHQNRNIHP